MRFKEQITHLWDVGHWNLEDQYSSFGKIRLDASRGLKKKSKKKKSFKKKSFKINFSNSASLKRGKTAAWICVELVNVRLPCANGSVCLSFSFFSFLL